MADNWEAMRHARLLLVNDDGGLQEIAASVFGREAPDITIDAALDGDEALELYRGESYDVVLTDLVHPGMNGVELAQRILERNPKQQLGFLTAWSPERTDKTHKDTYAQMSEFIERTHLPVLSLGNLGTESLVNFVRQMLPA